MTSSGTEGQQQFRAGTALVPVDVRVLDEAGSNVTGLIVADFEVREDGELQTIAHFAVVDYRESAASSPDDVSRSGDGLPSITAPSRTFLLVLGRGRLNGAARGLEAAMNFVRTGLRPGDLLGVVAYDRVTDLTREREPILHLLEVYQARHETIEAQLDNYYGGLAGLLAPPRLDGTPHPGIQRGIDALFDEPHLPAMRQLATVAEPDGLDLRARPDEPSVEAISAAGDLTNDAAARDDLHKLYAGISYLRNSIGEKHLVFLSEDGLLFLESSDVADGFAAIAADARVTVSAIHTGGLATKWTSDGVYLFPWENRWALLDSRSMANLTGGIFRAHRMATEGFSRLDHATQTGYVLGYYPPNRRRDGKYRRIDVTVKRPGVTPLYRHGYFDRDAPLSGDRRRVLAQARIATAAASRMPLRDLGVSLRASYVSRGAAGWRIRAEVVINPANVRFVEVDGVHVGQLNVAVFAGNPNDELVGESWESVDLKLDAATFQRLQRESISCETTFDLKGPGGRLKAVVYDYLGDRVGTATREIR